MTLVRAWLGDITRLRVDAIVNAANGSLLPGGGVCGAIHRAAGPELERECRGLGGCPVGEAKATSGHRLPARFVIHTVGPVWQGGGRGEAEQLAACYRRCLELARLLPAPRVAFPAISTGIFGFPPAEAAGIAVREVRRSAGPEIEEVILVAFDTATLALLERRLREAPGSGPR